MHITDLMDADLLDSMITEGYIRKVSHPTLPLYILGYSEKAQFERRWNAATLNCRGLIVDHDYNIVARPWRKFFNLGEGYAEFDWDSPVEVTDKVDGSLGILYHNPLSSFRGYGRDSLIATRGSFASDQAIHATKVWQEKYSSLIFDPSWTYLFEIVYPANRIVLDYKGMDDLVLLGAVHLEHDIYIGPGEASAYLNWTGPVAETFQYRTLQEAFSADPRPNAEGYVVRSGSKMVKIKQVDYIELHRIVTNLNEKTVWELMLQGKSCEQICEPIPDEWHEWVKGVYDRLDQEQARRAAEIVDEYVNLVSSAQTDLGLDRKAFALVASRSPNRKYLFKLYDEQPISEMVLQELKPVMSKE